jgi:hypothetical protein
MPKFPNDVADTRIFFEGVEKLFASFAVPAELQSKLLLPYSNDKAKSMLLRLDKTKQDNYEEIKKFLLRELKLSPVQFKSRFDHATRSSDKTYFTFCTRLKNYLTYYCHSRAIDGSFDDFFSSCVADKLKSTLSEACLDHVLTAGVTHGRNVMILLITLTRTLQIIHMMVVLKPQILRMRANSILMRLMLIRRENGMLIIREVVMVTRALIVAAAVMQASRTERRKLKTRSLLAVRILRPSKTRDCVIFANRRVIGSLIVPYVVDRLIAKVSRVQVHGRQHHATLHVPLIAL